MAPASDAELLVLLALRLRTLADADTLSAATGTDLSSTEATLRDLGEQGLARSREGRVSGWMLTAEGRESCASRLATELETSGARAAVGRAYERFLTVNQALLDLCTRWQLRVGDDGQDLENDHSDAGYDREVLAALAPVDAVGQDVCASLAAALARFEHYGRRLRDARSAVEGGDPDWLTRPTIDSYHTVWFELHENLLATLGRERGDEPLVPSSLQEAR
jgi:hypothetical protein